MRADVHGQQARPGGDGGDVDRAAAVARAAWPRPWPSSRPRRGRRPPAPCGPGRPARRRVEQRADLEEVLVVVPDPVRGRQVLIAQDRTDGAGHPERVGHAAPADDRERRGSPDGSGGTAGEPGGPRAPTPGRPAAAGGRRRRRRARRGATGWTRRSRSRRRPAGPRRSGSPTPGTAGSRNSSAGVTLSVRMSLLILTMVTGPVGNRASMTFASGSTISSTLGRTHPLRGERLRHDPEEAARASTRMWFSGRLTAGKYGIFSCSRAARPIRNG